MGDKIGFSFLSAKKRCFSFHSEKKKCFSFIRLLLKRLSPKVTTLFCVQRVFFIVEVFSRFSRESDRKKQIEEKSRLIVSSETTTTRIT